MICYSDIAGVNTSLTRLPLPSTHAGLPLLSLLCVQSLVLDVHLPLTCRRAWLQSPPNRLPSTGSVTITLTILRSYYSLGAATKGERMTTAKQPSDTSSSARTCILGYEPWRKFLATASRTNKTHTTTQEAVTKLTRPESNRDRYFRIIKVSTITASIPVNTA